jgi:phosphatidate phosphatase LPIN
MRVIGCVLTVLRSQTPIAEPDFLDLDAVPGKDATGNASAMSPPPSFIKLPPAGSPPAAHEDLPDTSTIPETPSEVLRSSFLLGRPTEYGTELAAAEVRALKDEERKHMGKIKDQIAPTQDFAKRHIPSVKVGTADQGDEALPVIDERRAKAPLVEYKHDVVLDMEGYHSRERSDRTVTGSERSVETEGVRHEIKIP